MAELEENVNEDLEKTAIEICAKILEGETIVVKGYECVVVPLAEECFKAGAKWKEQQMMKNAIEAEVQSAGCFIPLITPKEYGDKIPNIKFGDTIKVILVKEWQKKIKN